MFDSRITENIPSVALPFAVLGLAVDLLRPYLAVSDKVHQAGVTTHDAPSGTQAERLPVHDKVDGFKPFPFFTEVINHKFSIPLSLINFKLNSLPSLSKIIHQSSSVSLLMPVHKRTWCTWPPSAFTHKHYMVLGWGWRVV